MLEDIEALADRAFASKDVSIAQVAFITLIEWYDDLGTEFKQRREGILMKAATIFEIIGLKVRAEEYLLKIFDYIVVAQMEDMNTKFHHAIRNFKKHGPAGQKALMHTIRCCPLCRFKLRNGDGQTPLLLAVSTNEEEVVVAMIRRLRDSQRQFQTVLDAKDYRGLSILTIAIFAHCSLPLIDALIQCGSNVNPPTWPDGPPTPLQAASIPGRERPDIAWLLLKHHANPGNDSNIAALLAKGPLPIPAYDSLLPELDQQP
jgi:ankyrin repeat protein